MVELISKQHKFFNSNTTKNLDFRIKNLKKIKKLLRNNENLLFDAIYKDFKKSEFETYLTEFSLLYEEINTALRKLKKWSSRRIVRTGIAHFPAKSYIIPEPLGTVLVVGAWNYPIQLSLLPAISAMAAGNTVVIKPSEISSETSHAIASIINSNFEAEYLHVVEGGIAETSELLNCKFDKIFFTGSTQVGRIVYQAAAKNLCPVTLELGGKSPCFVFADCDIKMTAKRLVWAKFLNAGQTCVAPDYVLVEKQIESEFLNALKQEIGIYLSDNKQINENYVQIINHKNFDRLRALIRAEKVYCGADFDRENRYISPTILHNIEWEDEVMKDEIFGPILPVISFTNLQKMVEKVKEKPKPLSCYIYTKNRKIIKQLLREISFGGGAVNDSLVHISNSNLPFGGVGFSGIGSYHGKAGFDTFTHYKSILHKSFLFEAKLKYYPYSNFKHKIIRWIFDGISS